MSYLDKRGCLAWYVVYPAAGVDEGMGMERGPYLTRWGARLSRRIWGG